MKEGKTTKSPGWGGARAGAGRKKEKYPLEERTIVRLTKPMKKALDVLAGSEGMSTSEAARQLLAKALVRRGACSREQARID